MDYITTQDCKARKVSAAGVQYEMGSVKRGTPFTSDGVALHGYIKFNEQNWWVPVTCVKLVTDGGTEPPVETPPTLMRMQFSYDEGVTWSTDPDVWRLE